MLAENIKLIRTQKGYSQEILAQQLGVVRQTVSKWEKGLSVPDAELLAKLAELLDVPVSDLLGSEPPERRDDLSDVARQLAVLNEQMALQARRRRRTGKIALGVLCGLVALFVLYMALLIVCKAELDADRVLTTAELHCELNGESYTYGVTYDQQYRVIMAGGDAFVADHVNTEQYGDANILMAQIEDYFLLRGGSCEVKIFPGEPNP